MPTPEWPFEGSPHEVAVAARQVLAGRRPVCRVTRYARDDSWAFDSGTADGASDGEPITLAEVLALDPTLATVADLPPGWRAWRERRGMAWHRLRGDSGPWPAGTDPAGDARADAGIVIAVAGGVMFLLFHAARTLFPFDDPGIDQTLDPFLVFMACGAAGVVIGSFMYTTRAGRERRGFPVEPPRPGSEA